VRIRLIILIHLIYLHLKGSSSKIYLIDKSYKLNFSPFHLFKDLVSLILLVTCFRVRLSIFLEAENFIIIDLVSSPPHIKPEWYFLFLYCTLRRVPNKLMGVLFIIIIVIIVWALSININLIKTGTLSWRLIINNKLTLITIITLIGAAPITTIIIKRGLVSSLFYLFTLICIF
jgi:ubiquinol-cytochrome c reductase cytochrome b subunit